MSIQSIISQINSLPTWIILLISSWIFVWKGLALWKSARKNSVVWFVALLLINTFGILEILYIFVFSNLNLNKNLFIKKRKDKKEKLNLKKIRIKK